jgi:hypothetical protein
LFSSILNPDFRQACAADIWRVLKPNGMLIWYDFRYDNPMNRKVKGMTLKEIHRLFPAGRIRKYNITLLPPIARKIAPFSVSLCRLISLMPPLRSHILAFIEKFDL